MNKSTQNLSLPELIAIALGGMIGGGIFTILGVSVSLIGVFTPVAIFLGGCIALLASYSYVKLGVFYKDEGATYSFLKRTFPKSPFLASLIGWWVIFGYISTLALYAYTFSSYALSGFQFEDMEIARKIGAFGVIVIFTLINIWSVKGMGKIEDLMVYTKLFLLLIISFTLMNHASTTIPLLFESSKDISLFSIVIVASITFVAYEGFQLVINAVNEMPRPYLNIPRAIYTAIILAIVIYITIALGAVLAIPFNDIIANKEYALAAGAEDVLGHIGSDIVIIGALLATSSAISGTLFGASRQMAVISSDGYFPAFLAKRQGSIPVYAIIAMAFFAVVLIILGDLELILEFGSVTFLFVSMLVALTNYKIADATRSNKTLTFLAFIILLSASCLIFYYELTTNSKQIYFIVFLYILLSIAAYGFSKINKKMRNLVDKNLS